MIEALQLGRQHGYSELQAAMEKALDLSCIDVDAVRLLLQGERAGERGRYEAVEMGGLRMYDRPQPTTGSYDQLLGNSSVVGEGRR